MPQTSRLNIVTLVSVASCACVAADMVHEALGHGITSWLASDPILSISTVALQNASANRFVSASGTAANCILGAISLLLLGRMKIFNASAYFLWLFGAFNLFNSGYLVASAVLGGGDWANVVSGLTPALLWRVILALAGATLYVLSMRAVVRCILILVESGEIALPDLRRLVLAAYVTAGIVMTAASIFNPIGPALILMSGAGASFGLNAGLLFVPGIVASHSRSHPATTRPVPFSLVWLILAIVAAGGFICLLGPGIRISSALQSGF